MGEENENCNGGEEGGELRERGGEREREITPPPLPPVLLHEMDDMVEINGKVFHKPFVEKPVSAEDHNIYIYFPSDYGGGSQRLFRKVRDSRNFLSHSPSTCGCCCCLLCLKVKNRSSSYSKESSVRTKGSYIYEDFLATDGTDVKVYTVGPDYAHAEARKSPVSQLIGHMITM